MRLEARPFLGGRERVAIRDRREAVDSRSPAGSWARWPHHTRLVLLGHHGHDECSVDPRRSPNHDMALVTSIPHHDRRVIRKPTNLVLQLRSLIRRVCGAVATLGILHVMVNHNAHLIACVIPCFRQEHSSSPHTERIQTTSHCIPNQLGVGVGAHSALKLLHRDHVGTLAPDNSTVDTPQHTEDVSAICVAVGLDVCRVRVVPSHECKHAEAHSLDRLRRSHHRGGRGTRSEARRDVVQRLRTVSRRPPKLDLVG
mmetsp:Transcript_686/g.1921  ORF Transcript_686/g.1921 Transcript_686/m.1921 type:complete len:256 (+) Transcript_686:2049-2816(+)